MKKNILALLISLAMLIAPLASVAAFYCPEPPAGPGPVIPTWYITINEEGETFEFTEPEFGKCTEFQVGVSILNVTDLLGYEFTLWWDHPEYFNLTGYDYETYANDMFGEGKWFAVEPSVDYCGMSYYKQAISGKNADAFEGDSVVVVLTFHIIEDVCWCELPVEGWFGLSDRKMYDSCGELIDPTGYIPIHWEYIPVQPKVYIEPDEVYNCKLPGKFNLTVMVANVTKMSSIHFDLYWNKFYLHRWFPGLGWCDNRYTAIINFTDVIINKDKFPDAHTTFTYTALETSTEMGLRVDIDTDFTNCDLLRGDFWVVIIEFEKLDPWCPPSLIGYGRQPDYSKTGTCWTTENATATMYFWDGYIDGECGAGPYNQYFGRMYGDTEGLGPDRCWNLAVTYYECWAYCDDPESVYTLDPVVGDLDGDGDVNLDDLMIMASYYHLWDCCACYYDLNNDGVVDIGDVVIVGKNYGAECEE